MLYECKIGWWKQPQARRDLGSNLAQFYCWTWSTSSASVFMSVKYEIGLDELSRSISTLRYCEGRRILNES